MCKQNSALNNLQWLICHKTQPNQSKLNILLKHMYCYVLSFSPKQFIIY